jgi:hypothetical protein
MRRVDTGILCLFSRRLPGVGFIAALSIVFAWRSVPHTAIPRRQMSNSFLQGIRRRWAWPEARVVHRVWRRLPTRSQL